MIVAILAAYKQLHLKATNQASYAVYLEQYERLDAQLRDRAKDNVPTERQRAGFVSYVELQKVRKKLTFGSKERLLLSSVTTQTGLTNFAVPSKAMAATLNPLKWS